MSEMLSAFSRQDRPAMGLARQSLAHQTEPLLEAMKDYATLYLHVGSSPYPLVNLLTRLGPALESGEIGPAEMESLLAEAVQQFAQAQQQLHTANLMQEPGWRQKGAATRQAQQDHWAQQLAWVFAWNATALFCRSPASCGGGGAPPLDAGEEQV